MNTTNFQRRARIAWLNVQIVALRLAMSLEQGVTDEWKRLARSQSRLINQRNQLRTLEDIRRIEKRRGL